MLLRGRLGCGWGVVGGGGHWSWLQIDFPPSLQKHNISFLKKKSNAGVSFFLSFFGFCCEKLLSFFLSFFGLEDPSQSLD